MGAFVKKWFHLVLIFVFAYLAGSLAGQAANQFSSARELDTFPNEKQRISRMNAYIFLSNLLFLYIGFFGFLCYNGIEVKKLKVNTSKSKNAESFYIKQSYIDSNGKSTSRTIRKLGTLKELLVEHGPTRDDVMAWAKEQARIETEKFEQEKANHCIPITFHPDRMEMQQLRL